MLKRARSNDHVPLRSYALEKQSAASLPYIGALPDAGREKVSESCGSGVPCVVRGIYAAFAACSARVTYP
jgi:hypothetical protein